MNVRSLTFRAAVVAVLILAGAPLFAANYTANTSGDFNTATNYSPTATLPFTAADHITVDPSVTLTVSSDTTVGSITFSNGGGQLISLSPATTLNVSNVNGNGHGIEFGNPTLTNALISVGSGTLNVLDDIKIVGGISFSSGLSATTGGTIDATGGIEAAGTLANAKIDLSSGSALLRTSSDIDSGISFLRGTSAVEFYGSSSPQIVNFSGQYRHVKVSKSANTFLVFSSALTLDGDLSITGGILSDNGVNIVSTGTGTTLNIDANAELEVGIQTSGNATFLPSFDTYSFDVASKVTYGAAGAQSIDPTPTYGNLAIEFMGGAGSHIKSAGGDLNIAGNLTVLQAVAGGITFSGGSDTHTVAGGIDGNGAIDLGTTGILSIGDNFNNTGTFNAVGTVIYNGATGQNVKATIYDTLSFTGTNTNGLFLGNVTATTLFVDSASFVTLSGNNLIVVGDATVDGTINGPGTVAFSNPGTMNIAGSGSIFAPVTSDSRNIVPGSVLTFGSSFTLNNASTVITNSGTTEIEVNLTGPAGAMWTQANNSALTIGGNITTLTFDADASGSSVTYDGGNQTVYVTPYSHLTVTSTFPAAKSIPSISIGGNFTVTGSSNATLTGSVTIQGDVSVTATLDTDSFPMSVFGNWTVTGTFSPDTGVVSFDGSTTQEISGGQFYDLAFSDPGQKNINTSIDAGNDFTINATAVVAPQGGVTINVGGDWSNSGTYTPGTTEVIFDGASPQTVGATGNQTFHKLTLSSANANFSGPAVFVSDDLQVPSGNATLGSTNLTVSGNLIVAGALNQGTATIDLDGDLTLDGSFTAGGPFTFTGATAQSIGGIAAGITFASVTFNNPAGISSSLDIGASNATFTAGVVTLDPGKTFAVFNGAVSVTSGYVVGRFSRTETFPGSTLFPIGSPTTGYAPMSLTATSAGTAAAEVIDTPHPNNTGGGSDILQIYWTIHSSTFTGTVDLGFNWTAGAVNGTEASYVLAYHDGVSWSTPGGTVTPNTGTISGVNSYLGDWTAGNPASVTDLSYFEVTTNGSTTAGTSEAITITAKNSSSTTITSYTGDHTFVFSGASSSPNGDAPVVVDKDLNEVVFGSNTVLTFTNGVATTTMKLFAEESITLIANEGSVGGGVNVNVSADAASELAFDDINGGNLLYANSPFYVIVTAVDTFGNPSGVTGSTDVTLDLSNCGGCTGTINAATGTIPMSATQALISPNTYSAAEAAVILTAVATSGDALASVDSAPQTFNAQSASLVVTSDADSGAGSLREALELNNAGGCVTPCNITFEIAPGGAKNISLGTALPQITNPVTLDAATQDGYSGTPLINVDGAITAGANGLELTDTANGSVIRGLSFTNFERALVIGGSNHTVESCWIGIDAAGTVGPSTIGIYLNDASLSTIGGTAAGAGNVVVSSLEAGIVFGGDTTSVTVAGNHIGTDAAGTTAYSNDIGIRFDDSAIGNTIGGATAGHRNVISGNATAGIYLQGSGGGVIASAPRRKGRTVGRHGVAIGTGIVENNVIQGNYIGTNAAGNAALGNGYGIQLAADTLNNTIGPDNVLSGNVKGVYISHFSAQDNLIVGNYIGVTDTLAPLGNTFAGISVGDGTDNHIGDINPGDGNVIAHNTNEGIVVGGGSGTVILGNSIYNNTAQGIDLNDDGPDTNTAGDADLGANGTQNYPGIVSAELAGANLNLVFNLDSTSAPTVPQAIRFEFFEVDDNTSEEGKTAIGISPCLLGASFSNYPLSMAVAGVAVGDEIVATATSFADAGCGAHEDGTSEFSPAVAVAACTPPAVTITGGTSFCTGGSVTLDAGVHTSYLWSTGETTQTISVNAANTYSVTVTNATGCQGSDSHVVTVNPLPTPAITGPTTACNSATLDAGGGYTNYLWSTGETTQQITVTSSNTYSVTVTDGNGCQGSDSHAITVNASTPVTIAGPATACDSAVLDAGTGFTGYLWSTGETTQQITVTASNTYSVTATNASGCTSTYSHAVTINASTPVNITGSTTACDSAVLDAGTGFTSYLWSTGETTQQITVTSTNTYSVTATNAAGCATNDSHFITVHTSTPVTITGPATACGSATLDAGPGFAGYLWSTGETTQQITVTSTNTYSVTVTNGSGCTATDNHAVTVNPGTPVTITGPATACDSAILDAGPGFAGYLWSTGETTQQITVTSTNTYSVTATDGSGCAASDSHAITVNTSTPVVITGPATACGSATLDAGAGFASYLWSTGETTQQITVTASNTYNVVVTDGNGCTSNDTHTITVNPGTPVTITGPATACNSAVLDAGAGFASYLWSTGETTQQITVNATNTYSVAATDGNGCTSNDTHAVTVNASTPVTITGPATACGSAVLDAGAGFAGYLWSTGETTQQITVTATNTYSVTVTDGNGCSATDSHSVTVNPGTPVNITGPATACDNATLDAGAGFASYLWSTGETTQTISVSASNTYSVQVTDGSGCTSSDTHAVTVNTTIPVTITGPAAACGSAILDAGIGFFGYLWSTGETTQTITVTTGGTYSVSVTDSNGCPSSDTHAITINPGTPVTITGPVTACDSANLDAGAGFVSYLWSTGETTQTITVNAANTYGVQVTDGNGCTTSDSHAVNVNATTPVTITGPVTACGSAVLDAGAGFASYLWSTGETTQSITVTTGGTYSVSVTDSNGCPSSDTHGISVGAGTAVTITGPTTACDSAILDAGAGFASYLWNTGETTRTITVTASNAYAVTVTDSGSCTASDTHSVTINVTTPVAITGPATACGSAVLDAGAGFASYLWSTGETTQQITVTTGGTFSVSVTDANGCPSSDTHGISVSPGTPVTITGPANACDSAVLDAGAGFASYLWSTGETAQTITVTTGGTYSVQVTDGSGCTSSDTHAVTVNATTLVAITGPVTACGSATLDAGAGFATYLWSTSETTQTITVTTGGTFSVSVTDANGCPSSDTHGISVSAGTPVTITGPATACGSAILDAGAGFATYLWSTGETTQTINVTSSNTYSVTATDGTGCSATDSHAVTVNTATPVTITGPATACGSAVLDAGAGFATYLWSTGETSQTITVTTGGTYDVTVTDGNACSATDSHAITVNAGTPVTITGPPTACDSAVLDAGAGFASYLWSTGATTQTITVTTGGTYSVQATDGSGCTSSDTHGIAISTTTPVTITGPADACDNAVLDAGPGFATYLWSTGETTQSILVDVADTYSVTVTNAGGCSATDSHTVAILQASVTITGPAASCTPATLDAGAGYDTYLWSTGETTQTITVATGGTYSVTVTDGAGCTASDSHTVTINASAAVTITGPANICGSGILDAGAGFATYLWSTGEQTQTITVNTGGTYSVTVSDGNGCSGTDTHTVTVSPAVDATITAPATAPANTGGFLASVPNQAGATYAWSITNGSITAGQNTPSITFTTGNAGTTQLAVTVTNGGCSRSSTQNVTVTGGGTPVADASITKTAAASVQTGAILVYTINVANAGPASATDVTVSDPLPAGTTLVSINDGAFNCANFPAGIFCTGSLAAGQSATITITVNAPQAAGTITNTATVDSGIDDPNAANDIASATTIVFESGDCSTVAPQLTSPTGGTIGSPVTFAWTPVPQAIGYRVWIEVDGTAAQNLGTTDGAITLTADVPPGAIVAYVDAIFSGCPETRSTPVAFTVPARDGCGGRTAAIPFAPANGSTINASSVELRWHPANDPDAYRIWFSRDGGTPAVLGITTDETALRAHLEPGVIDWWAEALYDGCASIDSEHFRFTIPRRSECPQTRPDLLTPANNSTVGSAEVTFSWTAVPDAVEYEVWLSVGSSTPTAIGTTPTTSLTRLVTPGRLEWFVRAVVDRCPVRDSSVSRFAYLPPDACLDNQRPIGIAPLHNSRLTSPVDFAWSRPAGAASFDLFVVRGNDASQLVASTSEAEIDGVTLATGKLRWFVRAHFNGCSPLDSAEEKLEIVQPPACIPLVAPEIAVAGQASSGVPFLIQWTPIAGATSYELQLAPGGAFENAEIITTNDTSFELTRTNTGGAPVALYARVRALDSRCQPEPAVTPFGQRTAIFILPLTGVEAAAPLGGGMVTFNLQLGPELAGQTFSVAPQEPWLTVTPGSGVVGEGGTTLAVTADTTALPLGTSLAAVRITLTTAGANGVRSNATSVNIPTIGISKVTPVLPKPTSAPPPDALIIPAVAHANGINSTFQSDVRVTNSSAQLLQYQVTFTPSGTSIATGRQTQFSIEPGRTIALDDVLRSWFGTGGESVTGTLQIRPLTQTAASTSSAVLSGLPNLVTFAASRTFNVTANGTFGQYIPAIPFANFIGKAPALSAPAILSLQQIAQSDRYRTNLGIVEGSGNPASLLVKVFGNDGQKLTEFPVNLLGGQHTQLNSFLTANGVSTLADGRVEITVTSDGGKVTAYASVLDNKTSDPLLVTPVTLTDAGTNKWIIPGVADINNGSANWQTDMRVFNAGTAPVEATFLFYSQNGGEPKTAMVSIPAGQVRQFDKSLASIFGVANDGGAVHITTPAAARLVATARTYNQTSNGTYGQFISAVTPNEAAGVGSRPLQLLQVEESARYRSNIGLAEVTGNPVKIELTIIPPDAKFSAVTELTLQANEFRQLNSLLAAAGLTDTYNARVTVRAIEGTGRVTAYASVIDQVTKDPTYVPAQ